MAMGKRRRRAKQASMWVATSDLPRSAAHPFYTRLNQILDTHDFDGYVEELCQPFYADDGRPGLPPGRYFRLLLIGYFEGRGKPDACDLGREIENKTVGRLSGVR
jgi:transposase